MYNALFKNLNVNDIFYHFWKVNINIPKIKNNEVAIRFAWYNLCVYSLL